MRHCILIIVLFFLTTLGACQNRENIVVTGQIIDESTGQPISKAEVVVLCWYMHGFDEASFKKQTLTTDEEGNYKATFDKGYEVDIASKYVGYVPSRSYNELKDNEISVTLKLTKAKVNPSLLTLMNTDIVMIDMTDSIPFSIPFLRIRILKDKDNKKVDLNKIEPYGFDFSTLTTSRDTSKCDFWFKIEKQEALPTTITSNKNGSIIPVYDNEVISSFLFEKTTAPTTGYKKEMTLEGNEEGFFVLCRDGKTYGKIVWEKSSIDMSSSDGQGNSYKEFGKFFSALYQPNGTTDLSYSTPDMNLEDFLVDSRLR